MKTSLYVTRLVKWTGRVIGALMLLASACQAADIPLTWNPSPSTNIVGYIVYYGPSQGIYTNAVDVGDTTNWIRAYNPGQYWFVVTAYDSNSVESAPSNEITTTVPSDATTNIFILRFRQSTNSGLTWSTNSLTLTNVSASAWFQLVCEVAQRYTPSAMKQKALSASATPPMLPESTVRPVTSPKYMDR